ncbi:hypothetical protein HMPREF3293_03150 [Christensenella minuta]|uniref:Uncharacterized protein n=1 Tax=Christensenella minuta TaxID=626937 RepID=A0A136Q083_9FIRM|nr:hypothetical protein HMPREF3293_03150 [Christensenella minuta]
MRKRGSDPHESAVLDVSTKQADCNAYPAAAMRIARRANKKRMAACM